MRVVIGGLASRQALPVDRLDDLLLALEMLYIEEPADGEDVTLTVDVESGVFRVTLGGLRSALSRRALRRPNGVESADERADVLRLLMASLVDEYRAIDEASDGRFLVELEKRIA